MKLTQKEIRYILGLKKKKFSWVTDWMFEGTLEENHLTIYLIKPVHYIIKPILTPFFFIYLVLEEGVKEAKEDLKIQWKRDIGHLSLYEKECERAKIIKQRKEKNK